jgi:hypothetical protein
MATAHWRPDLENIPRLYAERDRLLDKVAGLRRARRIPEARGVERQMLAVSTKIESIEQELHRALAGPRKPPKRVTARRSLTPAKKLRPPGTRRGPTRT